MTMIETSVKGALKLLVIDVTANLKGTEHGVTDKMCELMKNAGVDLVGPKKPTTCREAVQALTERTEANALLLVAHGAKPESGSNAYRLMLADVVLPTSLLAQVDAHLTDKVLFLCICHGDSEDAQAALLREQLGLVLVAPQTTLKGSEAIAFFPPALGELAAISRERNGLTPEQVRDVVGKCAAYAAKKMRVSSAIGFLA